MNHIVFKSTKLCVPSHLRSNFEKLHQALIQHHYTNGSHFEFLTQSVELKSQPGRVASLRLSDKDRLLVYVFKHEGRRLYYIFDVVEHHRYSKSLAFKSQTLKQHLLQDWDAIELALLDGEVVQGALENRDAVELVVDSNTLEQTSFIELTLYNNQLIKFNPFQEAALKSLSHAYRLPHILSGLPGSGKTMLGIEILLQQEQVLMDESEGEERKEVEEDESSVYKSSYPIAYIAQSPRLVSYARNIKESCPDSVKKTTFLSYVDFLKQLPETAGKIILDEPFNTLDKQDLQSSHLGQWLLDYIKKDAKLASTSSNFANDLSRLIQEFRLLSNFVGQSFEKYQNIGRSNSLFPDIEDKKWIFTAFQRYLKHLEKKKLVHPLFYQVEAENVFQFTVADETQDLTPLQQKNIKKASGGRVVYLVDANQALQDGLSSMQHLMKLVGGIEHHTSLPLTHRCPNAVIKGANAILSIKQDVCGGRLDKVTQTVIPEDAEKEGAFYWFHQPDQLKKIPCFSDNPRAAIIVNTEDARIEAEKHFNTPLVFLPHEIKGLEFETILYYKPLHDYQTVQTIDACLKEHIETSGHRPKIKGLYPGLEAAVIFSNVLFAGFTRARDTLMVYQPEPKNKPAVRRVAQEIKVRSQCRVDLVHKAPIAKDAPMVQEDVSRAWKNLRNDLEARGLSRQVQAIDERYKAQQDDKQTLNIARPDALQKTPSETKECMSEVGHEKKESLKLKRKNRRHRRKKSETPILLSETKKDKLNMKAFKHGLEEALNPKSRKTLEDFFTKHTFSSIIKQPVKKEVLEIGLKKCLSTPYGVNILKEIGFLWGSQLLTNPDAEDIVHQYHYFTDNELIEAITIGKKITPIRFAIAQNRFDVFQRCVEEEKKRENSEHLTDERQKTFNFACDDNHVYAVQWLLDTPCYQAKEIFGPGFIIACHKKSMNVIEIMLNHPISKPEIPFIELDSLTPLFFACTMGLTSIAKQLLDRADIRKVQLNKNSYLRAPGSDGIFGSPLEVACKQEDGKMVKLLLQYYDELDFPQKMQCKYPKVVAQFLLKAVNEGAQFNYYDLNYCIDQLMALKVLMIKHGIEHPELAIIAHINQVSRMLCEFKEPKEEIESYLAKMNQTLFQASSSKVQSPLIELGLYKSHSKPEANSAVQTAELFETKQSHP